MTNEELLEQITNLLENQTLQINSKIDNLENRTLKIELMIEHDVTKRIDSLFEGYKLTHEKQWELEHKLEALLEIIAS